MKWYVLYGFKIDDKDETGFLALNPVGSKNGIYKIIDDAELALKLPSKNVKRVRGFGTPAKWRDFFNSEAELSEWKFHLTKTSAPK